LTTTTENKADFVGVKIGDVNMSAKTASARYLDVAAINLTDVYFKKGEVFSVPFYPSTTIGSYQFTLEFNELELIDIQGDKTNFALLENSILTACAVENSAFELVFKAKTDGKLSDYLVLNSNKTLAIAYDKNAIEMNIALRFEAPNTTFELHQNQPNPFNSHTIIKCNVPETTDANLSIFDLNGKVIAMVFKKCDKGYNEFVLDKTILPTAGIYFYQLSTPSHTAVRKMIVTE
jgi:hypothetical protein